jgi:hypothetical protein
LLGHGRVQVVVETRPSQPWVSGDRGQYPRLDLTEICANEDLSILRDDGSAHLDGHVMQSSGRSHSSGGTVTPGPRPPQAAVVTEMLVDPSVTVCSRNALSFSPCQKSVDEWVRVSELSQPPSTSIWHV